MKGVDVACVYFVLCDHAAVGVVELGILDPVPTCERCAAKVGAELHRGVFVATDDPNVLSFEPAA